MIDVFLSYSRRDRDLMDSLRWDLESRGLSVWTDENLTPGTERWRAAIQEAIEQARALVVVLTPNAKASTWISQEVAYARAQGVKIVPVLAQGDEKTAIPIDLINTQRIEGMAGADKRLADLIKPDRDKSKDGFYGKSAAQLEREIRASEEKHVNLQALLDNLRSPRQKRS